MSQVAQRGWWHTCNWWWVRLLGRMSGSSIDWITWWFVRLHRNAGGVLAAGSGAAGYLIKLLIDGIVDWLID